MLIDGRGCRRRRARPSRAAIRRPARCSPTSPKATREDIDRAVAAARRAFDGPWSKCKPYERQALLLKIADLVEQHFEELARSTPRHGRADQPHPRQPPARSGHAALLRRHGDRRCTARPSRTRCPARSSPSRSRSRSAWSARSSRGTARYGDDLEDRPGAGDRLHGGAEAGRGSAADAAAARRALPRGRRPAGRRQHRAGLRRDGRRGACRAPRTSTRSPSPART